MLHDEARLAATIRHPNVVPTLDVVAEGGELLVVMEYVEGDSLAHLAKVVLHNGQRIPPAFAAAIVAQALHGLHAAHEARDRNGEALGIVHRDVSPQNILVGSDGVARVLDFGIAKAASRATSTEDGQLKGKTAYMAPEQLQHGSVDRRTDIFAAAVCLWELLASRRLFAADSPQETMARVLTADIDRPSKHGADVPPALDAVVMRGLARDPERRFATAEEMAHALEDAVRIPRPKEIGGWVSEVAAATLNARAELVQVVERSSHRLEAAQTTDPELRRAIEEAERRRVVADMPTDVGARAPAAPPPPPPPAIAGQEHTQLSTVNTSQSVLPRTSRGSLVLALSGAIALLVALGVAFIATRPAASAGQAPAPEPEIVSVAVPVQPPAPPPVASSAAAPVARPVPSATASATPAAKRPGARSGSKKPGCEVPWEIDAQGLKHFKVECL
jgi:serine/threonine-protein kinase